MQLEKGLKNSLKNSGITKVKGNSSPLLSFRTNVPALPALARQKLDNAQEGKTRSGPGARHENNNGCYMRTRPALPALARQPWTDVSFVSSRSGPGARQPALARQKPENAPQRNTRSGPGSGPGRNLIHHTIPYSHHIIRFLPEPALSKNTKIPRFARNDRGEGVEMTEKAEGMNCYQNG